MSEEPVDLSPLRTPPPLGPHDFAHVRSRVMSEIAARRRTRWSFLVPLAAALVIAFLSIRSETPVPSAPEQRATAGPPAAISAQVIEPEIEPAPLPPVQKKTQTTARRKVHASSSEPVRIHIQTADPDVRIIWIVKENS